MNKFAVLFVVVILLASSISRSNAHSSDREKVKALNAEKEKLLRRLSEIETQLKLLSGQKEVGTAETIRLLYFDSSGKRLLVQEAGETDQVFAKRCSSPKEVAEREKEFTGRRKQIKMLWPTTQRDEDLKYLQTQKKILKSGLESWERIYAREKAEYDNALPQLKSAYKITLDQADRESAHARICIAVIEVRIKQLAATE